MLIAGIQPGGQLTITTEVENYPGFADAIQGPWLMDQMQAQAAHLGTKFVSDTITDVDLSRRPFKLTGDSGENLYLRCPDHRHRRVRQLAGAASGKQIPGLRGFGLRHLRRLLLSRQECRGGGRRQYRRRGSFVPHQFRRQGDPDPSPRLLRADKTNQARLAANKKIEILYDSEDRRSAGRRRAQRRHRHQASATPSPAVCTNLPCTGCSSPSAIRPATALFKGKLDMDKEGYIQTAPDSTHTSVAGVYAAGRRQG